MSYKCAACSKQGLKCIKFTDSISCLSCLKKNHPCNMTPFSEQDFSKFKKERVKLHSEKKLVCQCMLEAMTKINYLEKQEDSLDHQEAEALQHGFDNITELKRAEAKEMEKKQSTTESTNDSLPVLNPSFFETLLPGVMSQLDFLDETFEEVPSNS